MAYAIWMVGLRKVYAGLRKKEGRFTQFYAEFTQSLRRVYAEFTQSLRRVYAEFTWKAFPQPMCVNLRRASLRRVYAEFTQGATC